MTRRRTRTDLPPAPADPSARDARSGRGAELGRSMLRGAPRRGGRHGLAALVPLALLLASCATLRVEPPEPDVDPGVEVPPEWTAPGAGSLADAAEAPDAWWRAFGDPALTSVVEEALATSFDLEAAAARLTQAEARARIAGADLWPSVDGSFSGSRTRRNFIGFPIPGGEERVLSSTSTNLGVSLDVSWEADLWGRVLAGRNAARARVDVARADVAGAALSLTGQTARVYFATVEAREQVELARRSLESRELTTERVRRRYEAGLARPLELRLARADEASARSVLQARRRALDALERQLETLVGRYPGGALETEAALGPPPPPVPPGVPSEIVTRRPDLSAAEARLAAAGFEVARARAALYPRLALTGSAGRSSEELEDLLDSDFTVWSVAGNLLQPIFQGGRLRAGVDLARASFKEATALYAGQLLQALREVETALAADAFLEGQVEALGAAVEEAERALELARERYRAGLQDFLTVLEAERRLYDAASRRLEVRRARLDARIDLVLALGGGFQASEPPPPPAPNPGDPNP
ncbi:MAG: efflux transporter outer membrane subunit [Thermoanaerobaculia bacterium]